MESITDVGVERPEVAATNLEALSVDRCASQRPFGDSTLSGDEVAVALVADVGYAREAGPQTLRYRILPLEPPTPRSLTARCFKNAVLGEEGHDRVEISAVFTSPSISRFSPFTVSRSPVDVP